MSWEEYYQKTSQRPPRPLLTKALNLMGENGPKGGMAIDLGCGAGQDTFELLKNGWKVLAVDFTQAALDGIQQKVPTTLKENLTCLQKDFADIHELPKNEFVYASLSLPFCAQGGFKTFWAAITDSILANGYLAADFFGPEDEWVRSKKVNGHTLEEVKSLMASFEVLEIHEEKKIGATALGAQKFWHIISVIAKKKA